MGLRCKHEIEDEVHVLFDCPAYDNYRSKVDVLKSTPPYEQGTDQITQVFIDNSETTIKQICIKYLKTEIN